MARNQIIFHYDGPIAANHKVTLRTLGSTLNHLQSAIDRATIELRHGQVRKHARLRSDDYPFADFIVGEPQDGGYILVLINAGPLKIVDRITAAMDRAFKEASSDSLNFTESLASQAERREIAVQVGAQRPVALSHSAVVNQSAEARQLRYSDRAINREIDQVLAQIRVNRYEGSTLEFIFSGTNTSPAYLFDREKAQRFHHVVAERVLGDPLLMDVRLRALDSGSKSRYPVGKAIHVESGLTFGLHFRSSDSFNSVVGYMRSGDAPIVSIIACPIIEYGTFDSQAGDMFFIGLAR